ncbi:MAG: DUF2007 domain-containing protein [Sedimentisphaerales bacterium]|nr:DUF2007 domain-containing protein [Sedimentisphaerales bacterium]
MAEKLVTIAKYADSIKASLAQQLLADYGIKAVLTGQNAANVYTLPSVAVTDLQVLESQAEKARKVLKYQKKQEN